MLRNPTISFYFARRFARMGLVIFLVVFVLIAFVDYLELARRSVQRENFDAFWYLVISLTRVPTVIERALPFTVLFAAMASFVMANRQLELVVARASGLSAWQFILPACVVALGFGVFSTVAFNPAATALKEESIQILNRLTNEANGGGTNQDNKPIWVRQSGLEGSDGRQQFVQVQQRAVP